MMFMRKALQGAAASGSAAAATSAANSTLNPVQCRAAPAQQVERCVHVSGGKGKELAASASGALSPSKFKTTEEEGWVLTFFDDQQPTKEEVGAALSDVLGIAIAGTSARPLSRRGSLGSLSDAGSVESFGTDADRRMQEADRVTTVAAPLHLNDIMYNLLSNADVQRAVSKALKDDPDFNALCTSATGSQRPLGATMLPQLAAITLETESPRAPQGDGTHPLKELLEALYSRLQALDARIDAAVDGVARFFARIGTTLRSIMVSPQQQQQEGAGPQREPSKEEWWAGAIFTLAIAVMAVLVIKRVPMRG